LHVELNQIEKNGKLITIYGDMNNQSFIIDTVALLVTHKIQFSDLRIESSNLEDVFLNLTGTHIRE
jgi:hypothetical protein